MKQILKDATLHNIWFIILTIIAVSLIIGSFFVPPLGVVDGSILASVGEIFAFAGLGTVIKAIDKGSKASVSHGSTNITINE